MLFIRRAFWSDELGTAAGTPGTGSIVKSLAREVDELEALGLRNMAWKPSSESAFAPAVVDFRWLVLQADLPFLVPMIPPETLHRSLVAHGMEDSLEIIEHIHGRQLVRVLDHDIWAPNPEVLSDDISTQKVITWLRCWLEIGNEFLAARVADLEEETLVLLFSQLLDVQPEGIGQPDPSHADDYWTTSDGRFHLRVKDPDPEVFEIVKISMDALYGVDAKFAGSVLTYASMLVRGEALENAERWRKGRLADEGFVDRAEALAALRPRKLEELRSEISKAVTREKARKEFREKAGARALADAHSLQLGGVWEEELEEILDEARKTLRGLETVPALNAMARALGDEEIKLLVGPNVRNPEILLEDDDLVDEAVQAIVARSARLLWQGESAMARPFAEHRLLAERVFASIAETDAAVAADLKARLSRVSNTVVAGTAPQLDTDALGRALSVVRGAVNVGLEAVLASPADYGMTLREGTSLEQGRDVLELVGPEFLFHLGWSLLGDLSLRLARALDANPRLAKPAVALERLLLAQRFVELRRWLSDAESTLPQEVHHVVALLLNRVPLFPEVLALREPTLRATRDARAFESLADVSQTREFLDNFSKLNLE